MTVTTTQSAVVRLGNGVTTSFSFNFKVMEGETVKVSYIIGPSLVPLDPLDYTVQLNPSGLGGEVVFLTPPNLTDKLYIFRETPLLQSVSLSGQQSYDPEVAEDVWDRLVLMMQEIASEVARSVKTSPEDDPNLLLNQLFTYYTASQTAAAAAELAKAAAEEARDEAVLKENSMLRDVGPWATGIFYSPSDFFDFDGEVYITQVSHFSTTVAADVTAGRIRKLVQKGAAGVGTGDMLKAENLAGLVNIPAARNNLGLGTVAVKNFIEYADVDPAAVVTDVEALWTNKLPNAFATAKAITDYVDTRTPTVGPGGAPVYGCRGFINFNGISVAATYVRSGFVVTVTQAAHGMGTGDSAWFDFTSGGGTSGYYSVVVTGPNTYTFNDLVSGATSGNVQRRVWTRAAGNVSSLQRTATGTYLWTFAVALPSNNYAVGGACDPRTNHAARCIGVITMTANSLLFKTGLPGAATVVGTTEDCANIGITVHI